MIERDHHRRRDQHPPVAIEREERERSEDVKVGLDASAGQVDEQRAHQHLRDGDGVARRGLARPQDGEQRREQADEAAEHDRRPDVQVDAADGARPRQRRDPQREDDAGDPLKAHQPGEQPIGAPVDVALVLVEERVGAARRRAQRAGFGESGVMEVTQSIQLPRVKERAAEHVRVRSRAAGSRFSSATSDCRPRLSPACARAPVMPPLNTSAPRSS